MSQSVLQHGSAISRASAVYCRGALLEAVQQSRLFEDAKHFVDMPMRKDPEEVIAAFEALSADARADIEQLKAFVADNFDEPGAELEPYVIEDCLEEPLILGGTVCPRFKELAQALHNLWPTLCRVTAPSVAAFPQRNSALPRKYPMVLPGGRFRETYYWDSYWIVRGLLASGLTTVARGLVQNLLDDVVNFGFVPNGGRIYYLNRSQPPLLTRMVAAIARRMDSEEAMDYLRAAVPILQREYKFWMDGTHVVNVATWKLNRYNADWDAPRPESYWQDCESAAADASVYRQLASAAESGWDFTCRWADRGWPCGRSDAFRLRDTATNRCLPVDLNAILYDAERTLAALCEVIATGSDLAHVEATMSAGTELTSSGALAFLAAADSRRHAITKLMWNAEVGRWVDLWLPSPVAESGICNDVAALQNYQLSIGERSHSLADFAAPLWAGLADHEQAMACMEALNKSGLVGSAGVATTTTNTGEQWDSPNAWAPLQGMLVEGLSKADAPECQALALSLAQRWVQTCYVAWRRSGFMYEKYNAFEVGVGGDGGEYEPQVGFGWSNGVVLQFLECFGDRLKLDVACE